MPQVGEQSASIVERTIAVFDKMAIPGELILVDDGSTDNTRWLIEHGMSLYPNQVRGVFQEKNSGMEKA